MCFARHEDKTYRNIRIREALRARSDKLVGVGRFQCRGYKVRERELLERHPSIPRGGASDWLVLHTEKTGDGQGSRAGLEWGP